METAAANGVSIVALTDHDTTAGLAEAKAATQSTGLRLISGIELSVELNGVEAHLLGFGFDIEHDPLQAYLSEQREGRVGRMKRMVRVLKEYGLAIKADRVLEIAGNASVGRPHVARALVESGYVTSVADAFDKWLGDGRPGHITRDRLTPEEAISLVHEAGGVVFVAHPLFLGENYEQSVATLATMGLDGMETYYKHYDEETVASHEALSKELGLARSGGSDYHGLGNPNDREIGDIPFGDMAIEEFVSFLEERKVHGLMQTGAQ
tara:strand:- start:780 stop:1577 length:798 start_codon:yes stop_codon:yes gene_type:complete